MAATVAPPQIQLQVTLKITSTNAPQLQQRQQQQHKMNTHHQSIQAYHPSLATSFILQLLSIIMI